MALSWHARPLEVEVSQGVVGVVSLKRPGAFWEVSWPAGPLKFEGSQAFSEVAFRRGPMAFSWPVGPFKFKGCPWPFGSCLGRRDPLKFEAGGTPQIYEDQVSFECCLASGTL